ncbi:MAG: extracellular solute-binding protein [Bacillota bacterium]
MATIKEVAERAGVSIGTVSNVINGKKVNEALRVAVEKAISELNYTPHAVARSLKNNKTNNIALVLPNMMDTYLGEIIRNTERILRESGFNISLYFTNSIADDENKALENVMQRRFDGVVLYSCQDETASRIKELDQSGLPVVYLEKECVKGEAVNFVAFDNRAAVTDVLCYLSSLGHGRIALLSSDESFSDLTLIHGYREALPKYGLPFDEKLVRIVEATKENAFKEMFALLQIAQPPTAIILSNRAMADGIYEAAFFNGISIPKDLSLVTLAEKSWLKHGKMLHTAIERPVEEISRAVCNLLINNISRPKMFEPRKHYIKTELCVRGTCAPVNKQILRKSIRSTGKSLTVLLLESPAAHAIKLLLPHFKEQCGVDVEIEMLKFSELYRLTEKELVDRSPRYDVFMVDVSRFHAMCETGSIAEITSDVAADIGLHGGQFIEGLFESYCCYRGKVFGLPFMPGTQILFYRKDLFTDRELRAAYARQFDTPLRPPRNWIEFNKVAGFFTATLNGSPTPYGITMAAKLPVFVTNEFCPRKWAYGARAFDEDGNVAINSSEALNALQNFIQSYSYAPPWSFENDWDGEISDFCSGQCAMVIQYESHSTRISSRMRKDLKGCVGYDLVPGGNPLLGGWSLAVNKHSGKRDAALVFVRWACSHELAVPYSILGGTTAWKSYYKSADLRVLYPWLDVAYSSYKLARKRSSPYRGGPTIIRQGEYEEILGEEIIKAVAGEISLEACLQNAEARLKALLR